MYYTILHESAGRLRVRLGLSHMSLREADIVEYALKAGCPAKDVKVYDRTCDAVITFDEKDCRDRILKALEDLSIRDDAAISLVPEETGRALSRQYEEKLAAKIIGTVLRRLFFPAVFRTFWCCCKSVRFLGRGLGCLFRRRLQVPVLDAAAIGAAMLTGDFSTASSVMFLLDVGEILEEWTYKKSVGDLARSMSLKVSSAWMREGGEERLVPVSGIREGDLVVLRTSDIIPLDGTVEEGDVSVNQSAMTGESVPVVRTHGGYVYAGTVVEEGECLIRVARASGNGRYDQIVKMIEASEKLKSETETRAFGLADRLVPWSFAGAVITFILTRNIQRALSFLMVDFSCALKLSMPLSVLSAIRDASAFGISVKGGKFLEAAAEADTIVFDKTGTLTYSCPRVEKIICFDGSGEDEDLRFAACLEEHYPHSVARAVVSAAEERGLLHEEEHTKVQYVVAHGISSEIYGKKAVIGSRHFVFEDEGCVVPEGEDALFAALPEEFSHLYMAVDGRLKAVICISDPVREDAARVIDELHGLGFTKICMMTGDSERVAASVASKLSLDEYHAEVLPEDKAAFIRREREAGRRVIMVGDGINDTPALSEADAGVAISSGASIVKQISDINIASDSLESLVMLRRLSTALMGRINGNYRFIITFNAALIALGLAGILPPASSALLHNGSTILSGVKSMTPLLPAEKQA
ncbi:MAG: heavy metal translocating P-type ATPase [Firmicutes bacterium]|nr:heavy metal translocating P-type ATPase [Bacillota bacterium]